MCTSSPDLNSIGNCEAEGQTEGLLPWDSGGDERSGARGIGPAGSEFIQLCKDSLLEKTYQLKQHRGLLTEYRRMYATRSLIRSRGLLGFSLLYCEPNVNCMSVPPLLAPTSQVVNPRPLLDDWGPCLWAGCHRAWFLGRCCCRDKS